MLLGVISVWIVLGETAVSILRLGKVDQTKLFVGQ